MEEGCRELGHPASILNIMAETRFLSYAYLAAVFGTTSYRSPVLVQVVAIPLPESDL